jgi:protein TonB
VVEQLLALDGSLQPPPVQAPVRAKLPIPATDGQAQDPGVGLNTFSETGYVHVQDHGVTPLPYYKVERKPEVLHQVVPVYPELARAAGIQGRAVVQVVVDTAGTVGAAELLQGSGSPLLDAAALAAARGFRFRPGYQLDRPVPVTMAIPFSFRLD